MKKSIINGLIVAGILLILPSCAKSTADATAQNPVAAVSENKQEPFTEGVLRMGMFSQGIDIGALAHTVDFSQLDMQKDLKSILENNPEAKKATDLLQSISEKNPMAGLAMLFSINECDYHIKGDEVLGKVSGFGWEMDNYFSKDKDQGSLFIHTLVKTDKIPAADRSIYTEFKPSQNKGAGSISDMDFSEFERTTSDKKEIVAGYSCDVIVFTPKNVSEDQPMTMHKAVVYTSPMFSNSINFAHPYYLEEANGILRIDLYLTDNQTPTLVMKPKFIESKKLTAQQLESRSSSPVYSYTDINWGMKAMSLMMSGWGSMRK